MHSAPIALTIAGSDCSAGAGLQADLKTFQHFGVYGMTVATCVVAETPAEVRSIHPVPPTIIADQLAILLDSYPIGAIKTGMLHSAEIIELVAATLARHPSIPLVLDPVMIASTGDSLAEADTKGAYMDHLVQRATLITPNLDEAEAISGARITTESEQAMVARRLNEELGTAILLKGGHLAGPDCLDLLMDDGIRTDFRSPRIDTPASHGTGCTLSAAITAGLANGHSMTQAVSDAKVFLNQSLSHGLKLGDQHALNQATHFPDPTAK